MHFYFSPFEARRPPPPLINHPWINFLWQMLIVAALLLGANYIRWRWMDSLNYDALWYSVPLALAETLAYIGTCLFTINLWQVRDPLPHPAPDDIRQCLADPEGIAARPLKVDLFIATYSEDPELVRLSIQDAKRIDYPHPLEYKIHVLDDGRRDAMRQVAEQEGVNYLTRDNNAGFKAGNLRNGIEQTDGDFIVICDADTRVFPTLLTHTLGYFCDPNVAWVQTPQWFLRSGAGHAAAALAGAQGRARRRADRATDRAAGRSPARRRRSLHERSADVLRRDPASPQLGLCLVLLRRGLAAPA
ncbi:glycosyltransferase [Edwardsiella piscicida]|uniref:glycosyltransferase n=1 Tax=Edwardsiella piscicida TaxID=1263550 RepID=UPI00045C56FD|nr:glycosyltransferase [Edwardsiella piscicida]GAJ63170.1 cell wall biosynthesis glycosyltransferase [Edwardsiella piscicida]